MIDIIIKERRKAVKRVLARFVRDRHHSVLIEIRTGIAIIAILALMLPSFSLKDLQGAEVAPGSEKSAQPAAVAKEAKTLNNLVAELLNVQTPERQAHQQYRVINPRNGWIFISSKAEIKDDGQLWMVIDSADRKDAVISHDQGKPGTLEAMRYLPAGEHTLDVYCESTAFQNSLIVRAIPEILYAEIGYSRGGYPGWDRIFVGHYWPYTMEYLKNIKMLDNLNVLIERNETPKNAPYVEQWRKEGKKIFQYSNLLWMKGADGNYLFQWKGDWAKAVDSGSYYNYWSALKGMTDPGYQGIILDEVDANYAGLRSSETEGIKRISRNQQFNGKSVYAFCNNLFAEDFNRTFMQAVINGGYKFVEEQYLEEQPNEAGARQYLETELKQNILSYQKVFPGCQKNLVECFGYFNIPPESLNNNPGVDWKVWMDMQFNLIANDPVFLGLAGVMTYHSYSVDEETQRWTAKLYRHYCIEGQREMLSGDPYILPHIQNPDFLDGTTGWAISPAEKGSMEVKRKYGYATLQGRPKAEVAKVLWTRRSAAAPNRFSQNVKALEPGRLYSLKMITADYQEFMQEKSIEQKQQVSIRIEGVELLPDKSFEEVFHNSNSYGSFTGNENPFWMTYHVLVFRAKSGEGKLIVSDWGSDIEPGGPIGQELMFNFIEVQPYLEGDSTIFF